MGPSFPRRLFRGAGRSGDGVQRIGSRKSPKKDDDGMTNRANQDQEERSSAEGEEGLVLATDQAEPSRSQEEWGPGPREDWFTEGNCRRSLLAID